MDEIINLFKTADSTGVGSLSYDELRTILLRIGTPDQEIPSIFVAADTNQDGRIDYEEFVRWVFDGVGMQSQELMIGSDASASVMLRRIANSLIQAGTASETLFDSADCDRNGFMDRNEFYRVLQRFDSTLTQTLLDQAFAKCDCDNNGWISRDEFVAAINKCISDTEQPPAMQTVDIQVTVPPGTCPGQLVSVQHEGLEYQVQVPANFYPGQVFIQPIQVSAAPPAAAVSPGVENVQVVVPQGHFPGCPMAVNYKGLEYQTTVPEGHWPGHSFTLPVQT